MSDYFKLSHNPYYSVVAALPLLIAYEILLALTQTPFWRIRNAADVWIRNLLSVFHVTSQEATFVMIFALFFAIPFLHHRYAPIRWRYLGGMLIESFIYSILFGTIINAILHAILLAAPFQGNLLQNIALSLGAGLFEEFFFRVVLLNVLFWSLRPLIRKPMLNAAICIVLASFLFSLSHYIGEFGDLFDIYSFLFRWIAGLLFTIIYFLRGFAVAAYTHALYDIWVFL